MAGAITSLVIYDNVLFDYYGQIHRWAIGLERRFTWNARQAAPVNKRPFKSHWQHLAGFAYRGALQRNITGSVQKVGPKHFQTIIHSRAPYTLYVLRGTTGPITPAEGSYMIVPRNPGFGTHQRLRSVSGQRPQNFLQTAAAQTAARHPSIRGFSHHIG